MKIKILKKDFDNAVKQSWSSNTCILSQAAIRMGVMVDPCCTWKVAEAISEDSYDAKGLMDMFDQHFSQDPDHHCLFELQMLRQSLPMEIELSSTN